MGKGKDRQQRAEAIMEAIDQSEDHERMDEEAEVERQSQKIESAMKRSRDEKRSNG